MDYSPPGSSVHGIFQAKILAWVTIFVSRGFSQPRDRTHVSYIGRWILYHWATCKGQWMHDIFPKTWNCGKEWQFFVAIVWKSMRSSHKCELECELESGENKAWNSLLRLEFGFNPASIIRDIKEPKWNFCDLIKILIYFFRTMEWLRSSQFHVLTLLQPFMIYSFKYQQRRK